GRDVESRGIDIGPNNNYDGGQPRRSNPKSESRNPKLKCSAGLKISNSSRSTLSWSGVTELGPQFCAGSSTAFRCFMSGSFSSAFICTGNEFCASARLVALLLALEI